jgi:hypothetical protein
MKGRIGEARSHFIGAVQHNHGIKEENVLSLLFPVGIVERDLNQTWLNTMSSFGRDRGGFAHKSWLTVTPPDPMSIHQDVRLLIQGLGQIDKRLAELSK